MCSGDRGQWPGAQLDPALGIREWCGLSSGQAGEHTQLANHGLGARERQKEAVGGPPKSPVTPQHRAASDSCFRLRLRRDVRWVDDP